MEQIKNQTIGQLVAEGYRTAQVFRTFKLDFCCDGNRTVEEACEHKGVEYQEVREALELQQETASTEQHNYNDWTLDFLIDYIVNNHHKFTRKKLPEIGQYSKKVAAVHGDRHPELQQIYFEFTRLHGQIMNHLDKEEEILFPYVKQLVKARDTGELPETPGFGKAANPIAMMEHEHDEAGSAMEKIRDLSEDFNPPEDACTTYRLLYENLKAFEKDLHKHVHLENNILFPKAIKLEQSLKSH